MIDEIKKMSPQERLIIMEQIWDSLAEENQIPESPEWHKGLLESRQQRINSGQAKFLTLDELKRLKSV